MDTVELAYAGITKQAELIASGQLSSRELVDLYLARIERFNPQLNAFRVVFEESARMEADQADTRRQAGDQRPLLGVPIAVKDEFDVAGELTTSGTNAYGEPAREDCEIVRRIRAAGAVLIGKTHMPELGAFPWTESPTWGVTRNPWQLEHSPGGSSGGSAAAVAAGLVGGALAGDGGGSIRFPSSYCGLFGIKTQRGRVPLAPHEGAWHGLAVAGVLARSVADNALLYDAIADGPPDAGAPEVPQSSFLQALSQSGQIGPLRIAVSTKLPPSPLTRLHPENRAAVQETVELLRSLGHEVSECEINHGPMTPPLEFTALYLRSLHEEAATFARPQNLERRIRTLASIGGMLPSGVLDWALGRASAYTARLNEPLASNDVLLTPLTPAPPPRIGANEGLGWLRTSLAASATVAHAACWNFTGQPACSVPAGFTASGLPRSVQLIGRANDEATLIALSAQIESARPWTQERPPGFQ